MFANSQNPSLLECLRQYSSGKNLGHGENDILDERLWAIYLELSFLFSWNIH